MMVGGGICLNIDICSSIIVAEDAPSVLKQSPFVTYHVKMFMTGNELNLFLKIPFTIH